VSSRLDRVNQWGSQSWLRPAFLPAHALNQEKAAVLLLSSAAGDRFRAKQVGQPILAAAGIPAGPCAQPREGGRSSWPGPTSLL